jgi:hypothetical protein
MFKVGSTWIKTIRSEKIKPDKAGLRWAECLECGGNQEYMPAGTIEDDQWVCSKCYLIALPMPLWSGKRFRRNAVNGWYVLPIHYSADPKKQLDWAKEERRQFSTNPRSWDKFYEMDDEGPTGPRIFTGFAKPVHLKPDLAFDPSRPLIVGFDWGYQHPAAVMMQWTKERRQHVLCEVLGVTTPIKHFLREVEHIIRMEFGPRMRIGRWNNASELFQLQAEARLECWGDPAGNLHNTTGGTDISLARSMGWQVGWVRNSPILRIEKLTDLLRVGDDGEPRVYFSGKAYKVEAQVTGKDTPPNELPPVPMASTLIDGLMGQYQWETDAKGAIKSPLRPDKKRPENALVTHTIDAWGEATYCTWQHTDVMADEQADERPASPASFEAGYTERVHEETTTDPFQQLVQFYNGGPDYQLDFTTHP